MAKLTFAITSAIGNLSVDSPTLTDVQMTKFLDFIWDAYPQLNPDGSRKTRNNTNLAQAYRDFAGGLWQGTRANVLSYEREKAATTARDAVTPIEQ